MADRGQAMQRVGALAGLGEVLAGFGVSTDAVLAGTGIAPGELTFDNFVPFSAGLQVLEKAAAMTGCPHFGLLLGARYDHKSLGIIGRMMEAAPTLMDAFRDYTSVQIGYSRGAATYLHRQDGAFAFGYAIYGRHTPGGAQLYDLAMAIGCNIVKALTLGAASPEAVLLSRKPPADTRIYERVFGAPVLFDQNQSCLILSKAAIQAPLPGANQAERAQLQDQLRQRMAGNNPVSAQVRHRLLPQFLAGDPAMESVAAQMGMNVRSLGRALQAEGTGFLALRDEVRFAMARDLLELTDLPVGDIAEALAFATHSSFEHAFQRWSGMTPTSWRTAEQARVRAA